MNLRSRFEQLLLGLANASAPRPTPPTPPSCENNVVFRRHHRARRYVLRVDRDGQVIVTLPRRGSMTFAREFLAGRSAWIADQLAKRNAQREAARRREESCTLLFRGEEAVFAVDQIGAHPWVGIAGLAERIRQRPAETPRAAALRLLRTLAGRELPPLTLEFARLHQCNVTRVSVRNQRSRWGSCSVRGRISLNWKLVQAPVFVRDYIILHELMHLREMNHSRRFWHHVASVCPGYETAEKWLRAHHALLEPGSGF